MENYSGLLPFLWKTFKKPPQERRAAAPSVPPLSPHDVLEGRDDAAAAADDECFLHPELVTRIPKSPGMFGGSPGMFGRSPGMFGRSPGRSIHQRRHSTGASVFRLPKLLSSHSSSLSQRAR